MEELLLTGEEKRRFSFWLEHEINTAQEMLKVYEKNFPGNLGDAMAKKFKTEIAAKMFVLKDINSGESMDVS